MYRLTKGLHSELLKKALYEPKRHSFFAISVSMIKRFFALVSCHQYNERILFFINSYNTILWMQHHGDLL